MSKFLVRSSQTLIDLLVLSLAYWLAFLLRFEFEPSFKTVKLILFTWPYVLVLQYICLLVFGIPRFSWRFIGLREVSKITYAVGVAAVLLISVRLLAGPVGGYYKWVAIPLGVLVIDWLLATAGVTGVRVSRRLIGEHHQRKTRLPPQKAAARTVLIGAGQAGMMVAREIGDRPDLGLRVVGFLDDDALKVGSKIHGIPVLGRIEDMKTLCARVEATQAIITIANAPGRAIRQISEAAEEAGIPAKIIPGLYELVGGQVNLKRIRDVAVEDLLRREPIVLDQDTIADFVHDRIVLVTGAGGSIGSELCRQLARFGPSALILLDHAENSVYHIHRELRGGMPDLRIEPCVADIRHTRSMRRVFDRYRPEVVFHAAAHKHVPMMEWNSVEAIENNVFGTMQLADLAHEHGVDCFVMISTDKAVNPTSVMGATKRAAEIYIQSLGSRSETRFVTVRFGNVLGSAGSVIPLFRKQIGEGGPVTVTHPDMQRYFMTIPEACQLVLQAAAMGEGEEIFILDMGAPVKIVDLARDLIRLSGLVPNEDIDIKITGMRPGEKLFEELSTDRESADKTRHPKIFVGHLAPHEWPAVVERLSRLRSLVDAGADDATVRAELVALVPEFKAGTSAAKVSPEVASPRKRALPGPAPTA